MPRLTLYKYACSIFSHSTNGNNTRNHFICAVRAKFTILFIKIIAYIILHFRFSCILNIHKNNIDMIEFLKLVKGEDYPTLKKLHISPSESKYKNPLSKFIFLNKRCQGMEIWKENSQFQESYI